MPNSLTIAVDFDGTIVENRFPEIGKPILFAFESLIKLQDEGHRLILWTYRHGERLEEAVHFCQKNGLEFYAVNKSYPEEEFDHTISRKILADIFIDDRNLDGLKGWGEIYQSLTNNKPGKNGKKKKRTGLFRRF
ncbi:BT0820 family HAD-type phosphatase [Christiangramia crocea]|uniref:Hydrolase n=1 Tax=Christiangramia crocea TaxID=2904124 RepID=A0A9X1UV13_9FLAO|nr:hydrolase [Gramella crocea]MCG9970054.1 hydrolase [Gramella crocea]